VEDDQISILTIQTSFCFFVKTAVVEAIVAGTIFTISTQTWFIDFVIFCIADSVHVIISASDSSLTHESQTGFEIDDQLSIK
jgi:hypothetical protein